MRSYKPEKIKDLFGAYMGDPIKFNINGKEYVLDMRMPDLSKLMAASSESQENGFAEEGIKKMGFTILHMFYRSYLPYWNEAKDIELENLTPEQKKEQDEIKEGLNNFVVKKYNVIFTAIGEELGWITPTQAKKIDSQIEKLKSLGSQPQQLNKTP